MLLDGRQYQFITLFQFPGVFQYRPKIRGRCYRFQLDKDFKRRRPVGEGDRGRGGDNMLRIRHEIVDGSPDNCHRGTRVSIYLPPVLESHRQERAAMAREVAQNINWSLRAVFCCCSEPQYGLCTSSVNAYYWDIPGSRWAVHKDSSLRQGWLRRHSRRAYTFQQLEHNPRVPVMRP